MTEKGTEELVKLLKQECSTVENRIAEITAAASKIKTKWLQAGTEINEKTVLAYPTIAANQATDIAGMYWENGTWNKCTLWLSQHSMYNWTEGWSPLNLYACGDLYNPNFVQAVKDDGNYLNCWIKWMRTASLEIDKPIADGGRGGLYVWKGWLDMISDEGPRVISTPNNLIELTITAVSTVEVKSL